MNVCMEYPVERPLLEIFKFLVLSKAQFFIKPVVNHRSDRPADKYSSQTFQLSAVLPMQYMCVRLPPSIGCGNSTTCACLLSTTWPPGRMAIITRNHGDGAMRERESKKHRWREVGGERRRPAEPADTMSLKHKGDSWRWG